jgi:hypothetical protein
MASGRGLVTREPVSSSVKKELWQGMKELNEKTKVPISKLLDEAIEDLLIKRKGG